MCLPLPSGEREELPVRRRDLDVAEDHGLTCHPFVGLEAASGSESHFDGGRRSQVLTAGDDAHPAPSTHTHTAARVAEGHAGPAGNVQDTFVALRRGLTTERTE